MTERVALATLPTPLERMPRLGKLLGVERLLVKRDDLTGLAFGGNKARKLEHLGAAALAAGCDTLVTGGGVQSNHARITSAAAARLSLDCHLVLDGLSPDRKTANVLLDHLFGATLHFTGSAHDYNELENEIERVGSALERSGRRPYVIPIGGASAPGVAAYADAAAELLEQLDAHAPDTIVLADGSGGTHAGLLAGLPASTTVVGVDVGTRPELATVVARLATEAASTTGRREPIGAVRIDRDFFGDGYGEMTPSGLEALRLTAQLEGIALDPVYTAKAMAGLIGRIRDDSIDPTGTIVFWHTGGSVALFADRYAETLSAETRRG
ncbi:MAG TPA: D-cysteine desulfhydrase family protein [Acidimicrobiia bacterium]|nr:D-cysteine desulfhydrase family protein [Acidimicrobiia bacterium]